MPPRTLDPVEPTTPLDTDVEFSGYVGYVRYMGVYDEAPVDKTPLLEEPEDKVVVPR